MSCFGKFSYGIRDGLRGVTAAESRRINVALRVIPHSTTDTFVFPPDLASCDGAPHVCYILTCFFPN